MLFVDSKVDSSCVFYQSCSVVFLFGVDTSQPKLLEPNTGRHRVRSVHFFLRPVEIVFGLATIIRADSCVLFVYWRGIWLHVLRKQA